MGDLIEIIGMVLYRAIPIKFFLRIMEELFSKIDRRKALWYVANVIGIVVSWEGW